MLANAGFCSIHDSLMRPNYGRVNFNLGNMNVIDSNPEEFENNLETTIHEILHVLGFSGYSM
jgi:proprotein convertase subtilisin/kexin type 5